MPREKKLPPQEKRCHYRGEDGQQCRAARLLDSDYCFFHDPLVEDSRQELEQLEELQLGRPSEVHGLLVEIIKQVRKNRLKPKQAYALGWLVQLLMQNREAVEHEKDVYKAESYGREFKRLLEEKLHGEEEGGQNGKEGGEDVEELEPSEGGGEGAGK